MGKLNIYGVYVPVLVIQAVLAYIVLRLLMRVTDPWVDKGWIFLPSIFYLCLYITSAWHSPLGFYRELCLSAHLIEMNEVK